MALSAAGRAALSEPVTGVLLQATPLNRQWLLWAHGLALLPDAAVVALPRLPPPTAAPAAPLYRLRLPAPGEEFSLSVTRSSASRCV